MCMNVTDALTLSAWLLRQNATALFGNAWPGKPGKKPDCGKCVTAANAKSSTTAATTDATTSAMIAEMIIEMIAGTIGGTTTGMMPAENRTIASIMTTEAMTATRTPAETTRAGVTIRELTTGRSSASARTATKACKNSKTAMPMSNNASKAKSANACSSGKNMNNAASVTSKASARNMSSAARVKNKASTSNIGNTNVCSRKKPAVAASPNRQESEDGLRSSSKAARKTGHKAQDVLTGAGAKAGNP